ncbi:hypothetical protein FA13DRAFT_674153 [Coprinellus micaceus]|uniref:Uncharacterized protein n=1 Tax=Coprinellus micaceus TaxID=71717 RepID=A0A4Y7T6Z2_COPMI|nr:hypothetical protein FA13DRAFT_674153 [Coprinellus micaceus]
MRPSSRPGRYQRLQVTTSSASTTESPLTSALYRTPLPPGLFKSSMAGFAREDFASPTRKVERAQAGPNVAEKRLSNRSLPVSQLPPELLAQIMAGSLTFMELTWDNAQRNTLHPHPSIALSHVSSSWREVALRSHELWSRIQIQMLTRSSILEFLWRNAGSMPVDLEFCGSRLNCGPCPRAFAVISTILRTELGRIRSIRTFCEVQVLKPILSEIVGHAESLEHLQLLGMRISIDDPLPSSVGEKFLSGGAPKLRYIKTMAVSLPWTSQAFTSPSLTHANFCYMENDLAGLFTFLRHAPQLEVLKVENLPYINEAFRPNRFPIVNMPNLKKLYLGNGGEWESICTALSTL